MVPELSLPVMWSEHDGPARPGRLDLSSSTLRLEGGSRDGAHTCELELTEIARAYIGRTQAERIGGRTTLVLELREGGTLRVTGVERPGAVRELADRILRVVPG